MYLFREEELGLYTMYTGQGDPYKLANIAKFNGMEKLGDFFYRLITYFRII